MRRSLLLTLVLCCAAPLFSAPPPPLPERLATFFRGWYAHIPGSDVVVTPTNDVVFRGSRPTGWSGAPEGPGEPGEGRRCVCVFARAEGMNAAAAREFAADIADAAGAREAYNAEIASGRARGRVLRDISLAQRLGVMGTPSFLFRGTLLPGEKGVLEDYLFASLPAAPGRTATPAP